MPKNLRRAHEANDRAVMEAYDFPRNFSERQMINALFEMYERLVATMEIFRGE